MSGLIERPEKLVLRSTLTSPYGRKVRMAVQIHKLADSVIVEPADTLNERDSLREQNPLGKIPCLLLPDGQVLFDSRVIVEYLDAISSRAPLVPVGTPDRFRVLTRAALSDGLTDAALLLVYEGRFRSVEQASQRWIDHQRDKVFRALTALSAAPPPSRHTDLSSIALACALGYLDWRQPVSWRTDYPVLVDWLERFTEHEAAVAGTAA